MYWGCIGFRVIGVMLGLGFRMVLRHVQVPKFLGYRITKRFAMPQYALTRAKAPEDLVHLAVYWGPYFGPLFEQLVWFIV